MKQSQSTDPRGPLASIEKYVPQRNEYQDLVETLDKLFAPKRNPTYERHGHAFRKMKQDENEKIEMFVLRLRQQIELCEFGDRAEEFLKDQITEGCISDTLRRKILERGDDNLEDILKMARIFEAVSEQQKVFTNKNRIESPYTERVNKIENKGTWTKWKSNVGVECSRCGLRGHRSADAKCPAKGKQCAKCGGQDHYARKCFTKNVNKIKRHSNGKGNVSDDQPIKKQNNFSEEKIQYVIGSAGKTDDYDEDVFCVVTGNDNKVACNIGSVETS